MCKNQCVLTQQQSIKYIREKLTELKRKIDKSTIIDRGFNTPRTSDRTKAKIQSEQRNSPKEST